MELRPTLTINEVFFSIQGESNLMGFPTVFVRTTGCNLRCGYCDTKYSYFEGELKSISEIVSTVTSYKPSYVCITGGEPLAQKNTILLMQHLLDLGLTVSLETSGSFDTKDVPNKVIKVIDVKTPGSGEVKSFEEKNLERLTSADQLKFVICDDADYAWSKNFVLSRDLFEKCTILFSPAFETMGPKYLAEKILEDRLPVRLQLQLHKYIWSPHLRGV